MEQLHDLVGKAKDALKSLETATQWSPIGLGLEDHECHHRTIICRPYQRKKCPLWIEATHQF